MEYVIKTEHLSRRFGKVEAVKDLNLRVPQGSVYGFLGPNGAGKTTTIRMLLGLTKPSSGSIQVLGQPADSGKHRPGLASCPTSPILQLDAGKNFSSSWAASSIPYRDLRKRLRNCWRSPATGVRPGRRLFPGHEAALGAGPGPAQQSRSFS